jgi:hypothetical protein
VWDPLTAYEGAGLIKRRSRWAGRGEAGAPPACSRVNVSYAARQLGHAARCACASSACARSRISTRAPATTRRRGTQELAVDRRGGALEQGEVLAVGDVERGHHLLGRAPLEIAHRPHGAVAPLEIAGSRGSALVGVGARGRASARDVGQRDGVHDEPVAAAPARYIRDESLERVAVIEGLGERIARAFPAVLPGWGVSWWIAEQGVNRRAFHAITADERQALIVEYWRAFAAGWQPSVPRDRWIGSHHPFDRRTLSCPGCGQAPVVGSTGAASQPDASYRCGRRV